jgi:hypothetical protein
MSPLALPPGYARICVVQSFAELISTPFGDGVNALCWPRELPGDFAEIVDRLGPGEGINPVDDERLLALELSPAGQIARRILLEDQQRLREHGLEPVLDCIHGYQREEDESAIVPTHVYSFHADSAPVEADTWLCTYLGASSEGLRNDQARRRIEVPETRARLLQAWRDDPGGGVAAEDGAEFREYLAENCFDLHYAPDPGALLFTFGVGHLWRIAIEHPECPVPPCIHRAPETLPGDPPRLLLLS